MRPLRITLLFRHYWVMVGFLLLALAAPPAARAKDAAVLLTFSQPGHFTLDKLASTDFALALPKGQYLVVLDLRLLDGHYSNINTHVELLHKDGVVINSNLTNTIDIGSTVRCGQAIAIHKNIGARLRVVNEEQVMEEGWLTVVPLAGHAFVPFGWGTAVTPVPVDSENGPGGSFSHPGEEGYYRATLPAGKWAVSVGAKTRVAQPLDIEMRVLDSNGFPDPAYSTLRVNDLTQQEREQTTIRLLKPRTFVFRVVNGANYGFSKDRPIPVAYDLTVRRAED